MSSVIRHKSAEANGRSSLVDGGLSDPLQLPAAQVLQSVGCWVVLRDAAGRIVYMNDEARRLYGPIDESPELDRALVRLRADGSVLAFDDMALTAVLESGEAKRGRLGGVISPDGQVRWARSDIVPIKNAAGKVIGVLGSGSEVTELKRVQEQLSDREAYFRALVENISDVITVLDKDGKILYTSPSIERQFGYSPGERLSRGGEELVHPDDLPEARRRYAEALRNPGSCVTVVSRARHGDGSWHWTEGVFHNLLDDPNVLGVVVNWRDITAQRAAQERERVASERWQRLIAESPNAVVTVDQRGHVLSWNAGAQRVFGWPAEEVLGKPFPWIARTQRAGTLNMLRRVGQTGRTEAVEGACLTREGRQIPVIGHVGRLPMNRNASHSPEFILTYTDMTVHIQAEQQAKMLALLEDRERIAMELHDGVIQSLYGVSLNLSSGLRSKRPDYASVIGRATAQLNDIIRDVRNYIFDLRPERLGEQSLEDGLKLLADEVRINGLLRVDSHIDPELSSALPPAVVVELLWIVREATSNVIRHAQATAMDVILERRDTLLVLTVRDNGRGFDPTAPEVKHGEGIANMHTRARALGGSTHLMSAEGKGTVVCIELPVPRSSAPELGRRRVRVLVVDDHELVRLGLIQILQGSPNLDVAGEAGTVEAAVSAALELKPDVVLMDVRLSDGSGIEACRLIRSERPATKVVMLTSYSDDEAVLESILAGASGYLLKQTDPSQLASSLERVAAGESLIHPTSMQTALSLIRRPAQPHQDDPISKLTPQEGKVLRLMAEGKTNREIARILAISDHTVRTYASNIFSKLHVTRRAEAAAMAARQLALN